MKFSTLLLAMSGLLAAGCSEPPTSEDPAATASTAASTAPAATPKAEMTYRVLEAIPNESKSKLNADVLLSRKISEAQLREISQKITDSLSGYQRSYLFFYLPGMKVGSGAWATASFTPDEEIQTLGATQAQEDSSKHKLQVDGRLIGKWYEEQRSSSALAFYEKGGKYFRSRVFRGGTPTITRLVKTGNKFKPVQEPDFGEYFQVQNDGTLAFINEEGKVFGQAAPIQ